MARNSLKNVVRLIGEATKELPVQDAFLADLKRSIELTDKQNSRVPSKTYKPSSMQCIRQMYYQVIGIAPDDTFTSSSLVGICNAGTDAHERIQGYVSKMQENGIDCEWIDVASYIKSRNLDYLEIKDKKDFETKLYHKQLNLSFMCDGIIKYKGHYYILELKTENSNKFFKRTDTDMKHHNQATAYSIAFGIDDVIFVYISRDTYDMKAYLFKPAVEMKEALIGKIEMCDEYVKLQSAPPKPVELPRGVCEYCNYKNTCRKDG